MNRMTASLFAAHSVSNSFNCGPLSAVVEVHFTYIVGNLNGKVHNTEKNRLHECAGGVKQGQLQASSKASKNSGQLHTPQAARLSFLTAICSTSPLSISIRSVWRELTLPLLS